MTNKPVIIFDMDGVIIDTGSIWKLANTQFLAKRGKIYNEKEVRNKINGKSPIEAITILQQIYSFDGDPQMQSVERKEIVIEKYKTELEYYPGFLSLIAQVAKQGLKKCIATGADHHLLEIINDRLDLRSYFGDHIYSVEDVGHVSKPDPATFLYSAKKLGADPSDCIVIEDSPLGIEAARRGGMKSIGVTTSTTRDKLSDADLIVDSLNEINLDSFF